MGCDGGIPRILIIASAERRCIDRSQLGRGKNDERGAMRAGHLLTAVKAEEYPPAIWSGAIPTENEVRRGASGQRKERGKGDHVDQG